MCFKCSIGVIIVLLLPGLTLASTVIGGEQIIPLREPRYEGENACQFIWL